MTYNAENARETTTKARENGLPVDPAEIVRQQFSHQVEVVLRHWHESISSAAEKGEQRCIIGGGWNDQDASFYSPRGFFDIHLMPPASFVSPKPNFWGKTSGPVTVDPKYLALIREWVSDEANLFEHLKVVIAKLREEGFSVKLSQGLGEAVGGNAAYLIIEW